MIFSFLTDLAKNNNKEWFDAHKEAYECAKLEATLLFNYIYTGLAEHDTLAPLKIYRIYRDLRFSKDKTPYKTHFGCYIQRKQPTRTKKIYCVCVRKFLSMLRISKR